MKILMINSVCGIRSTGRICTDLADALTEQGHNVKIAYGREDVPEQYKKYAVRIGSDFDVKLHGVRARLLDESGFGSKKATERFIEWVKRYDPDVIHLHNIHGYYINIEVLFDYLRTCGKKIIWTLHDCWAFTGHAAYCEAANCERWKTGCHNCPKRDDYPKSFFDNSKLNWLKKRKIFSGIPNLQIITPSKWLAGLVKKSFLRKYPVSVIYNGVDTSVFKPVDSSDIRRKLNIGDKKVILGVAAVWDARKGLEDFIKLNKLIDKNEYQIVLVGLTEKQIANLPKSIIGITRTDSVEQLVELYSLAHVFVNPTYEDNYPTTNLEAIACGTPVITYDTGGSPESAALFGFCINKGSVRDLYDSIANTALDFSVVKHLDYALAVKKYLKLYGFSGSKRKSIKKVLYVTNLPAPYKIDLFELMSKEIDLTVIYERHTATNRDKKWMNDAKRSFKEIYLNGKEIGEESSFAPSIIKYISKNKYDVIIMNGYSSPTAMIAITYMKIRRIPFGLSFDGMMLKTKNTIKKHIKRFLISSGQFWLYSNDSTMDELVSLGANKSNCYKYPFTSISQSDIEKTDLINESEWKTIREASKKKLGIKNTKMVLSVGQFIPRKGFDLLLHVAKEFDDNYLFCFVGGKPTSEFLSIIRKNDITNVRFVGFLSKNEIADYYKAADLFVLPTRYDVWGLVVNEAMMYHLPVITTDKCGAGLELVKNGDNGYMIPTENYRELSTMITNILNDDILRKKMSTNSFQVIKHFTIENMADIHLRVIKKEYQRRNPS